MLLTMTSVVLTQTYTVYLTAAALPINHGSSFMIVYCTLIRTMGTQTQHGIILHLHLLKLLIQCEAIYTDGAMSSPYYYKRVCT